MKKTYLLTPGPTPIPEAVISAFAQPILHHRSSDFAEILKNVRQGLKKVFQTKQDILIISSTGTGAMEGSVSNCFAKGDEVIVIRGGKFGERWGQLAETFGLKPHMVDVEWGKAVDPAVIGKMVQDNPNIRGVLVQASETSTGVIHPIRELAGICKESPNTLLVVDAITGVGAFDIPMDRWGIDVLLAGSQKAFMLPPGLAFVALSEKAWKATERSDLPKYYFDFKKELKAAQKNSTAYTPAVSLIIGLQKVLELMDSEGLENIFRRHEICAKATRAGVQAMGLELFAPEDPAPSVTAVKVPDGVDGKKIVKLMKERYGVWIAGGQSKLEGKIFRLAHLGYSGQFDVIVGLSALEVTLRDLGFACEPAAGVAAAQRVFAELHEPVTPWLSTEGQQ